MKNKSKFPGPANFKFHYFRLLIERCTISVCSSKKGRRNFIFCEAQFYENLCRCAFNSVTQFTALAQDTILLELHDKTFSSNVPERARCLNGPCASLANSAENFYVIIHNFYFSRKTKEHKWKPNLFAMVKVKYLNSSFSPLVVHNPSYPLKSTLSNFSHSALVGKTWNFIFRHRRCYFSPIQEPLLSLLVSHISSGVQKHANSDSPFEIESRGERMKHPEKLPPPPTSPFNER